MKYINNRTGIDILACDDVHRLRQIIMENEIDTQAFAQEYGFFLIKCYKENLPLLTVKDWIKTRNNG